MRNNHGSDCECSECIPWKCPFCGEKRHWNIDQTRANYCGPGDTNYIMCHCKNCGKNWNIRD